MQITGISQKEIYRDEKTGYTGFFLSIDDKKIFCKGIIQDTKQCLPITLTGEYHSDNGKIYFAFSSYEVSESNYSILNSLNIFEPHDLKTVSESLPPLHNLFKSGITSATFKNYLPQEYKEYSRAMYSKIKKLFSDKELCDLILNNGGRYIDFLHINKKYPNAIERLKENPYFYGLINGFKFRTCENIAIQERIDKLDIIRAEGILNYIISDLYSSGHSYINANDLEKYSIQYGGDNTIPGEYLKSIAKISNKFYYDYNNGGIIGLYSMKNAENSLANNLIRLQKSSNKKNIDFSIFKDICNKSNIELSKSQINALKCISSEGISIITGGPGSGKTTLMNVILQYIKETEPESKICLCAPTGCAAQNMAIKTGLPAETIHRVLGLEPYSENTFTVTKKLTANIYIIDESSMMDIMLAKYLFESIPLHSTVIMVGDIDQLPSVGAGNILSDIIESNKFPVYSLEGSFRQSGGSSIISNANNVLIGNDDLICNNEFSIMSVNTPEDAYELALAYITEGDENYQILSPVKKGATGIYKFNNGIQNILNPNQNIRLRYGANKFKLNDEIIMVTNNYQKGYYNGDRGKIIDADEYGLEVHLYNNNKNVYISTAELSDISLAYALTIHKSQGSEYDNVLIILTNDSINMLNKNLLYTAITRAKKTVTIIETKGALSSAIKRPAPKRYTRLKYLLCDNFDK